MKPGVYRGIPNEEYHSGPGVSKSGLDLVRKSPALFRAVKTGKRTKESTRSQMRGTTLHAMVLEPELVSATYALPFTAPEGTLTTVDQIKAALSDGDVPFKQATKKGDLEDLVRSHLPALPLMSDVRAAYDAENEGKVIIEPEDWDRLLNMLEAVRAHPAAMKLLSGAGEPELSCYWEEPVIDPATGAVVNDDDGKPVSILMRCRPDYWRHDGILVDIKTCASGAAAREEFARSIEKWRYYVQHPLYLRGAKAALAEQQRQDDSFDEFMPPREFVFVVVEADACVVDGVSMGVAVYRLGDDSTALGVAEYRKDIARIHQCESSGKWPGYSDRIEHIELPAYAFTRAAERISA